jgi:hypothetical protein
MYQNLIEDLTEAAQNSIAQQDTKLAAVCIITIIDLIRQDEIRTGRVQEQDRQRAIKQIMRCLTPQVTPDTVVFHDDAIEIQHRGVESHYWIRDEWIEDPEVVFSIANAVHAIHTDPGLLDRTSHANQLEENRFTCANCGKEHQPCPCGNPTYCPPEEPGEPFHYCDKCDAAIEAAERLAADKARKEVATLIMGVAGDLQHSKGSYRSIVRRNKPQEVVFVAYGEDQAQADAFAALVIKGVIDMR